MSSAGYELLNTSNKDDIFNNGEQINLENNQTANGDERDGTSNAVSSSTSFGRHVYTQSPKLVQMAVGTLAIIVLYLSLSICITFYQGALIKSIKYPFSIVVYHLIIKFIMSACVRAVYNWRLGKPRVQLDWRTSLRKMAPTGVASGIDVGFSNLGFELVQITLYTITKSSTIIFILFFAIILGLEKKSWSLVFIVGLISTGLFMFTYKSTQFNALGFTFLLIASFSGGIRWSFAQFVMQKSKLGLHNPIDMIFHMQPWMILPILPLAIYFEGNGLLEMLRRLPKTTNSTVYLIILRVTVGAVIAFFMEVSEFLVLSRTSSLTLSIVGIFKDIFQVALAVQFNGEDISTMNVLGLVVCLAGIYFHVIHKYSMLTTSRNDEKKTYNVNKDTKTSMLCGNASKNVLIRKHSGQTVPLLVNSDSEDSSIMEDQNASEVIFDVLKRRDTQR